MEQLFKSDTERLLAMIMALGGELFVLKAEMKRLKIALNKHEFISERDLDFVAESSEFAFWLSSEEKEFGEHLMNSYTQADKVGQVHEYLTGEHPVMEK